MPLPDKNGFSEFAIGAHAHNKAGLDALLPAVYDELHALAGLYLRRDSPEQPLQPTALVHEAYARLSEQRLVEWRDRAQFYGVAAQMMRRILVNYAQARNATKRGGHVARVTLDESLGWEGGRELDLISLDGALSALALLDQRQARIVEVRLFAGLSIEETAEVLNISAATVKLEWITAKVWLHNELANG